LELECGFCLQFSTFYGINKMSEFFDYSPQGAISAKADYFGGLMRLHFKVGELEQDVVVPSWAELYAFQNAVNMILNLMRRTVPGPVSVAVYVPSPDFAGNPLSIIVNEGKIFEGRFTFEMDKSGLSKKDIAKHLIIMTKNSLVFHRQFSELTEKEYTNIVQITGTYTAVS